VGGSDQEDHSSRLAQAKKFRKPRLNRKKKLGVVVYNCHPTGIRKPKLGEL
jgi:hypothetical protein